MAKFYGAIGFAETKETKPGVWTDAITERAYRGESIKVNRLWQSADQVNDNLNITDQISVMADDFAYANSHKIRYVVYTGAKWKVASISPQRPRLVLTLGGLYNG